MYCVLHILQYFMLFADYDNNNQQQQQQQQKARPGAIEVGAH